MQVKIKRLDPAATIPQYATEGAACFDLCAIGDAALPPGEGGLPIEFYGAVAFRTGLAFEIPVWYALKVYSRSGHGFKHGVRLSNGTGIIDSDYRGELIISLRNDGDEPFIVRKGDRIAQAIVIPVQQVTFEEVSELSETKRGQGGFGSTGA